MIAEVIRLKTGSGCPRENFIPIFTRMRYKIVRDGLMKYTPCPAVILLCKVAVNLKRLYAYQDGCYWLAQQPAFLVWVSFSHCADRSTVPPCLSGGFAPHFTRGFGQLWAVSLCLFLFAPAAGEDQQTILMPVIGNSSNNFHKRGSNVHAGERIPEPSGGKMARFLHGAGLKRKHGIPPGAKSPQAAACGLFAPFRSCIRWAPP